MRKSKQSVAGLNKTRKILDDFERDLARSMAKTGWNPGVVSFPLASVKPEGVNEIKARLSSYMNGAQPAVVKLVSYGGAKRLNVLLNYISREGGLKIELHDGKAIGCDGLKAVKEDWENLMDDRAASRDLAVFSLSLSRSSIGSDDVHVELRKIMELGFSDRSYAYKIENDGVGETLKITGVMVLRSSDGERLTGDLKATKIYQSLFDNILPRENVKFSFSGYGNGVDYGLAKLEALVQPQQQLHTNDGGILNDKNEIYTLVNDKWKNEIHSRKPRDVMHLMISSRAGTNVEMFEKSVRGFLGAAFGDAGHKYVFAVHDPTHDIKEAEEGGKRPHVHAHAIVTLKNIHGERLSVDREMFKAWRSLMSDHARSNGIAMVMTDRRDTLAPPAYTKSDARPIIYEAGKATVYEGINSAGQKRLENKILNIPHLPNTPRSIKYAVRAKIAYEELARETDNEQVRNAAKKQIMRFDEAKKQRYVNKALLFRNIREGILIMANTPLTSSNFEIYKSDVNKSIEKLQSRISPNERKDFDELVKAANNVVTQRESVIRTQERIDQNLYGEQAVNQGKAFIDQIEKEKRNIAKGAGSYAVKDGEAGTTLKLQKLYQQAVDKAVKDNNVYLLNYLTKIPEANKLVTEKTRNLDSLTKTIATRKVIDDRER